MGFDARYFGEALSRAFGRFGDALQKQDLLKLQEEYELAQAKALLEAKQKDPLYLSQIALNNARVKKLGVDTGKSKANSSNPGGYDYSGLKRR